MSSSHGSRWRPALFVALGLFFVSRIVTLTAFPIFNDETIYLRYAQQIHEDWATNKFISMNGEFTDWKPPLQYWMAMPFIEWGNDPLVVGRVIACLVSVAGFFGVYLFSTQLFTEREGVFAAVLYVICPPVLLHNDQFTAETFLFSTAPLLYWSVLKAMRPDKVAWGWFITAATLGAALLLFKQSGLLLLAISILLPLARLQPNRDILSQPSRTFLRNLALVVSVVVLSMLIANALLPAEFNATRDRFNSRWTMALGELAGLPFAAWRSNLEIVGDYIASYYSWAALLFFGIFSCLAVRRRNFTELTLVLMCLAGAAALIFLLRGFNEYLFNTAVIAVFLPLLARTGVLVSEFVRLRKTGLLRYAILLCAVLFVAYWGYQDVLMNVSAGKYFERSSHWARSNYLQSWSTGFGVKEVVAILETEKRPGIVFADSQWGNPGTALEVYRRKRFPNLRIVNVSREFLDRSETQKLRDFVLRAGPAHLAIYSADPTDGRMNWQANISEQMCKTRTEITAYPSQMPIVVCQF
jgi:4-amino-4-deoxy-L-arabinose transferase-like glycosyltransferase